VERKKSSGRSSHGDEAASAGEAKGLVPPGFAIAEVETKRSVSNYQCTLASWQLQCRAVGRRECRASVVLDSGPAFTVCTCCAGCAGRSSLCQIQDTGSREPMPVSCLEMAMGKYPPGITTPYPYPRQKNNPNGSPIYTGGYGFTPIPIPTWVWVTHRVTRTHKN
jgi:hypothetical protein